MNLERPIAPDPYELLPKVASFTLESTDIKPEGADRRKTTSMPAGTARHSSPGAAHPPARRATSSPASIPTPRHPRASGIGSSWTCRARSHRQPARGAKVGRALPSGAFHCRNDYGSADYGGPAPPKGDRPHRYYFAVHALDVERLGVDASDFTRRRIVHDARAYSGQRTARGDLSAALSLRCRRSKTPADAHPSVQGRTSNPSVSTSRIDSSLGGGAGGVGGEERDGLGLATGSRGCTVGRGRRGNQPRTVAPARSSFATRLRSPCGAHGARAAGPDRTGWGRASSAASLRQVPPIFRVLRDRDPSRGRSMIDPRFRRHLACLDGVTKREERVVQTLLARRDFDQISAHPASLELDHPADVPEVLSRQSRVSRGHLKPRHGQYPGFWVIPGATSQLGLRDRVEGLERRDAQTARRPRAGADQIGPAVALERELELALEVDRGEHVCLGGDFVAQRVGRSPARTRSRL